MIYFQVQTLNRLILMLVSKKILTPADGIKIHSETLNSLREGLEESGLKPTNEYEEKVLASAIENVEQMIQRYNELSRVFIEAELRGSKEIPTM